MCRCYEWGELRSICCAFAGYLGKPRQRRRVKSALHANACVNLPHRVSHTPATSERVAGWLGCLGLPPRPERGDIQKCFGLRKSVSTVYPFFAHFSRWLWYARVSHRAGVLPDFRAFFNAWSRSYLRLSVERCTRFLRGLHRGSSSTRATAPCAFTATRGTTTSHTNGRW
jgi:hypothetical protein